MHTKFQKNLIDFSFLLPALIIFAVMIVLPFFMGAVIAFTDWNGLTKTFNFIGFRNFVRLFQTPAIAQDTLHTVYFTVLQTTSVNIVGLALALLITRATVMNHFLRTVFFLPFMCSIVFCAFVWSYFYADVMKAVFGTINPLSSTTWVIPGIALIALWRDAGYAMIIYLAGLQAIPESLYEAAVVDGVNPIQKFFKITVPLLVPSLMINITLYIGWGLKTFDYVMAATGGGPGGSSSETVAILVYKYAFPYNRAGLGQAFALVMMLVIVVITQGIARFFRSKEVEY